MLRSYDADIDFDINLESSFASNRTSNIFHPKILYTLFLVFDLFCTNSDIIFYILALAISREEILYVLQSQGQIACLIVDLREKTIYKSALFLFGGNRAKDILQKKVIGEP